MLKVVDVDGWSSSNVNAIFITDEIDDNSLSNSRGSRSYTFFILFIDKHVKF
jgi:hypothetical protein